MRQIGLAVVLAVSIFLASFAAGGQQAAKAHRIGFLGTSSATDYAVFLKAFRQRLRDLGHEEGRTLLIEYRWRTDMQRVSRRSRRSWCGSNPMSS